MNISHGDEEEEEEEEEEVEEVAGCDRTSGHLSNCKKLQSCPKLTEGVWVQDFMQCPARCQEDFFLHIFFWLHQNFNSALQCSKLMLHQVTSAKFGVNEC